MQQHISRLEEMKDSVSTSQWQQMAIITIKFFG